MQISDELLQKILDQPTPVALSQLTPYCSEFTLNAFSQYRKHFKNARQQMNMPICLLSFFQLTEKGHSADICRGCALLLFFCAR